MPSISLSLLQGTWQAFHGNFLGFVWATFELMECPCSGLNIGNSSSTEEVYEHRYLEICQRDRAYFVYRHSQGCDAFCQHCQALWLYLQSSSWFLPLHWWKWSSRLKSKAQSWQCLCTHQWIQMLPHIRLRLPHLDLRRLPDRLQLSRIWADRMYLQGQELPSNHLLTKECA